MKWLARACRIVILLLSLAGCQGRGDLQGTVKYQEKMLQMGSVLAVGGDGIPHSDLIKNGSFHIKDLPAGPIRLAVNSSDPGTAKFGARKPDEEKFTPNRTGWFPIPAKYAEFSTSNLTFELKAGPNKHDITLE